MKKIILPLSLLSVALFTGAHGESFESPFYRAGQFLKESDIWLSSIPSGLAITEGQAAEGTQSLEVAEGVTVTIATHLDGVKFYQFYLLTNFQETAADAMVNVAGAEFSFVKISQTIGGVAVYLPPSAVSVLPRSNLPLIAGNPNSETWVLITVRVDSAKKKWDLYLDGKPVAANLALSQKTNLFSLTAVGGSAYLDAYSECSENPLFVDSDRDGLPDAEEIAIGLNAYGDDRMGDIDGDGVSNADEFFSGQPPQISQSASSEGRPVLYVDNLNGSDANTGCHSYISSGSEGPKASIGAAMHSAASGSVITVLAGTGSYQERTLGIAGKDLTIKTVEPIKIK